MQLGEVHGPFPAEVDADRARAFAAALGDTSPAYVEGRLAPPTFVVALTREPMFQVLNATVPAGGLGGGVHGEQDMTWHQPLVPRARVSSTIEVRSLRVGPSGSRLTLLISTRDEAGAPVVDQHWTTFFRGATLGEAGGPDPPAHTFPEEARRRPVAHVEIPIDADLPIRYGRASGEDSAIHVDREAARQAGFDDIIAHGMSSLALCAAAIVDRVGGGDPTRLARLAVRFSGVAYPGTALHMTAYAVAEGVYAFEALAGGRAVLTHGRAELGPSRA